MFWIQLTGGGWEESSRKGSQAERELARRWRLCKTEVRRLTCPKTSDPVCLRHHTPCPPRPAARDRHARGCLRPPCAWSRGGFALHLTDRDSRNLDSPRPQSSALSRVRISPRPFQQFRFFECSPFFDCNRSDLARYGGLQPVNHSPCLFKLLSRSQAALTRPRPVCALDRVTSNY